MEFWGAGCVCGACARAWPRLPVCLCCTAHTQLQLSVRLECMRFCKPHKHKSHMNHAPNAIIHRNTNHKPQTLNPKLQTPTQVRCTCVPGVVCAREAGQQQPTAVPRTSACSQLMSRPQQAAAAECCRRPARVIVPNENSVEFPARAFSCCSCRPRRRGRQRRVCFLIKKRELSVALSLVCCVVCAPVLTGTHACVCV